MEDLEKGEITDNVQSTLSPIYGVEININIYSLLILATSGLSSRLDLPCNLKASNALIGLVPRNIATLLPRLYWQNVYDLRQ